MIVPELLGEDEALVSRASALFQGATRVTMLLGPVLGGVLIPVFSAPGVLVVDAATYIVSATLVAGLVPRPEPLPADGEDRGLRRGLRFLSTEPLLRIWTPVFAIGDGAWTAFFVSVPVLVIARFGVDPRIAGVLVASFGVGAVCSANIVAYRVLLERVEGLRVIAFCVLGQALPLWLLTVHLHWGAYCAALAVSGDRQRPRQPEHPRPDDAANPTGAASDGDDHDDDRVRRRAAARGARRRSCARARSAPSR